MSLSIIKKCVNRIPKDWLVVAREQSARLRNTCTLCHISRQSSPRFALQDIHCGRGDDKRIACKLALRSKRRELVGSETSSLLLYFLFSRFSRKIFFLISQALFFYSCLTRKELDKNKLSFYRFTCWSLRTIKPRAFTALWGVPPRYARVIINFYKPS